MLGNSNICTGAAKIDSAKSLSTVCANTHGCFFSSTLVKICPQSSLCKAVDQGRVTLFFRKKIAKKICLFSILAPSAASLASNWREERKKSLFSIGEVTQTRANDGDGGDAGKTWRASRAPGISFFCARGWRRAHPRAHMTTSYRSSPV